MIIKRAFRLAHVGMFVPVYLANIFLSLHYAAILYVNSTFLGQFFDTSALSILFILAAVMNLAFFLAVPALLSLFSIRFLYISFVITTALALVGMAYSGIAILAGLFFAVYASSLFMIYYCLDIFLEDVSVESRTGEIRGSYLTLGNASIAAGPLLLPLLVTGEELALVYIAAVMLLVPPLILGFFYLRIRVRGQVLERKSSMSLPFAAWWRQASIRRATLSRLALETFYTLMIIYTPIYLHGVLGFSWAELGVMFAIMLLPFVLFEWPMGKLADRLYGEKEIMSIGFVIIGMSLLGMPFLAKSFLPWVAVMFISRIGASFVEVATESHFFKHVDERDGSLISIFRLARPVGIMLGATIGFLTLSFFSLDKIFFFVAILMFLSLRQSLRLKDTL